MNTRQITAAAYPNPVTARIDFVVRRLASWAGKQIFNRLWRTQPRREAVHFAEIA
jgi:hypothetical protein